MKREVAILWADALESGEYKQTRGGLRDAIDYGPDGGPVFEYCCLGVLCDIAPVGGWQDAKSRTYTGSGTGLNGCYFPTTEVAEWAGIPTPESANPNVLLLDRCDGSCTTGRSKYYPGTASHMNDLHHWSFMQIARAIRERYAPDTLPTNGTLEVA